MTRWERFKVAWVVAMALFFLQAFFLIFNLQFVDETTGQFRLGAQFRFKFVDETTRQFVLVSELQKLPGELLTALELCGASLVITFVGLGVLIRFRPETLHRLHAGLEPRASPPPDAILKRARDSGRIEKRSK